MAEYAAVKSPLLPDPYYQDYFEAHLAELLERYPVDGLFVDMLEVHP